MYFKGGQVKSVKQEMQNILEVHPPDATLCRKIETYTTPTTSPPIKGPFTIFLSYKNFQPSWMQLSENRLGNTA